MLATLLLAVSGLGNPCEDFAELDCYAAEHGIILNGGEQAASFAATLDEGAARYSRYFGDLESGVALVVGGDVDADLVQRLQASGMRTLPWLTAEQQQGQIEQSVRDQVMAQMEGMPPELVEQTVQRALAQLPARTFAEKSASVLMHEASHLFFIGFFGSGNGSQSYGSAAPDWLDEVAAVLAEDEAMQGNRRRQFTEMREMDGDDGLYPLAEYLTMDHPIAAATRELAERDREPGTGARMIVLSGSEAEQMQEASNPIRFYSQSRAFADFLIEASGDDLVFRDVSSALAGGRSFEEWLSHNQYGLPQDLAALEREWHEFAQGYAPPE